MTLIILLIVLLVERFGLKAEYWQPKYYLLWYFDKTKEYFEKPTHAKSTFLSVLVLPALISVVFCWYVLGPLFEFIVSLFVLAVCVGDIKSRILYRKYLNALSREDEEAQYLHQNELKGDWQTPQSDDAEQNHEQQVEDAHLQHLKDETLGETLIWINFKYYAAPIFYFVLLGLPGVILYTTVLYAVESDKVNTPHYARRWLEVLFWVPARFVSLGYMLVGHFTHGLETWLKYAANVSKSSREMLCKVALASENAPEENLRENAKRMVSLTKRNMVVFLVVVALLTLYGQIV